MANFSIECPKCGTINTASNSLFAKKKIRCVSCGTEIDTKVSRIITKQCPHCGRTCAYDQAKVKGNTYVCPFCNEKINITEAVSVKYQLVTVNCPHCNQAVEADSTSHDFPCPLCGETFDVPKAVLQEKALKNTKTTVLQYEGDNRTFVWKHPIEDFNYGTQLIVHETQEAIFFYNGQALDSFSAGRYTLTNENVPILRKLSGISQGEQTPFHAEVYFVNKTVQMGIKWGTQSRVNFIDPLTQIPLDIGARGELSLQVTDTRKLLIKLVGTETSFTHKDLFGDDEARLSGNGKFNAIFQSAIKANLAKAIQSQNINIFQIDSKLEELSSLLKERIEPDFKEYGFIVPNFAVSAISLPEENDNFRQIKKLITDKYLAVEKQRVDTQIKLAEREAILAGKTTELETMKIDMEMQKMQAETAAYSEKVHGMTAAEIMEAQKYSQRDIINADVQKAYAESLGKMGSSGGGGGSGVVSEIVGAIAGVKAAEVASGKIGASLGSAVNAATAPASNAWTCSCGNVNTGKFCSACGKPRAIPNEWTCPSCGHTGNKGNFCEECGTKRV